VSLILLLAAITELALAGLPARPVSTIHHSEVTAIGEAHQHVGAVMLRVLMVDITTGGPGLQLLVDSGLLPGLLRPLEARRRANGSQQRTG